MLDRSEGSVALHYARSDLETAILGALIASGKDPDHLQPSDLAPVDQFHTAGLQGTVELAALLDFSPGMHILDIGCGIGGPSRYFAAELGCNVTGIDLTEDYVRVAAALSLRVGLEGRTSYQRASALALPFAPETFDGGYLIHVGMNIADKPKLFGEARRVLRRGGTFAVFDIMRTADGELAYPLHWAATSGTSFLAAPAAYQRDLEAAGFSIEKQRNRREFAREFFRQLLARNAESGTPPLGTHILLKTDAPEKLANFVRNLEAGLIAPVELICRAV